MLAPCQKPNFQFLQINHVCILCSERPKVDAE
jgi:hypothetical protein